MPAVAFPRKGFDAPVHGFKHGLIILLIFFLLSPFLRLSFHRLLSLAFILLGGGECKAAAYIGHLALFVRDPYIRRSRVS